MGRVLCSLAAALVLLLSAASAAMACSTGRSATLHEVRDSARLIAIVDVLAAPDGALRYRARVIDVIKGRGIAAGSTITVGPKSGVPASYPDCWLALKVGTRALLALPDTGNLDALASYAWWEEAGALVTASPVAETRLRTLKDLAAALATPPDTATAPAAPAPSGASVLPATILAVLSMVAASAYVAPRRSPRQGRGR